MFKETLAEEKEMATLCFLQETKDGVYAEVCGECLTEERLDLAQEELEETVYYFSFG